VQDGKVRLQLRSLKGSSNGNSNGTTREVVVDHVIAATGYKVDLERLQFLSPDLRSQVRTVNGAPVLTSNFESSMKGLYFAGIAAANTFGPVMRFAFGAGFAARRLAKTLGQSQSQNAKAEALHFAASASPMHRRPRTSPSDHRDSESSQVMKRETIAIHAGYDGDPTTKAVAVPIYQTVAFEFDSAEHGAALFNLEVEGNIYTRIGNPTNAVLEKRVAALEGGVDGLSVSSGMAAIEYSLINIAERGTTLFRFRSCTVLLIRCWHIFSRSEASVRALRRVIGPKMWRN
jgi:hypothetical protein